MEKVENRTVTPTVAKRALEGHGGGKWIAPLPQSLRLREIGRHPAVFQHRDTRHEGARLLHVRNLAKAIEPGHPLDPVKVWWSGREWVCIDGHHRLDAYGAAKWAEPIPVEVFAGSLSEAIAEALRDNVKVRRQMSATERTNGAWRVVAMTDDGSASKATLAERTGASEGTIANMRRTAKKLGGIDPKRDWAELSWPQARNTAKGIESGQAPDFNEEAEVQARVERFRALGVKLPMTYSEVQLWAKAMCAIDGRFPELVLSEYDGDTSDEDADHEAPA
jgi:hypothetical protein